MRRVMKTFGAILILMLSMSFASAQTTDRRPDSNGAAGPTPQAETGKLSKTAASESGQAVTAPGEPTV